MHGLTLVLIIFAGIVIQCEGNRQYRHELSDLYGVIIGKNRPVMAKNALNGMPKLFKKGTAITTVEETLKDYALICPCSEDSQEQAEAYFVYGFRNFHHLELFINQVQHRIKRLVFNYDAEVSDELRNAIPIIIHERSNQLLELFISCEGSDDAVWNLLSNKRGNIIRFSRVMKFQFCGNLTRNRFNMTRIFPMLRDLKLFGPVEDFNVLNTVKDLRELILYNNSISDNQLSSIIGKNQDLLVFGISANESSTMAVIANRLMNLKIFRLEIIHQNIFIPPKNAFKNKHRFPNVKQFIVSFHGIEGKIKKIPFDMPCLEMITLNVEQFDDKAIAFINHFKHQKCLKMIRLQEKCVENLEKIREHLEESTWIWDQEFADTHLLFVRQPASSSK